MSSPILLSSGLEQTLMLLTVLSNGCFEEYPATRDNSVAARELWRLQRSFRDALEVAREGAVAEARMSFGRRLEGGDLECVWVEDAILML